MKLSVLPLLFFSTLCLAQSKPKPFDIPFDFNQVTCHTKTDSLVGQEIYFFPRNQMYQGTTLEKDTILFGFRSETKRSLIAAIPPAYIEDVKKNIWSALNVYSGKLISLNSADTLTDVYKPLMMLNGGNKQFLIFSPYSAFEDKLFKIIAAQDSAIEDGNCMIRLTLQDPYGEILHWDVSSLAIRTYTVCFKGYIKYLSAAVLKKKLYIRHENWVQPYYFNHLDGTLHASIPGQEFVCSDITVFNIRNRIFPHLAIVLTDTAGITTLVDPGSEVIPERPLTLSAFCNEETNAKYMRREKKVKDSLVIVRKVLEKKMATPNAYVQSLVKQYGKEIARHIIRKEVTEGMTKEMCREAWGNTHTTQLFTVGNATIEVWGYSLYRWLRFKDEKLVGYNE